MDRAVIVIGIVVVAVLLGVLWRRYREGRADTITDRVDGTALGLSGDTRAVVLFKGPLCYDCQRWASALDEHALTYRSVDVVDERDLSAKHGVSAVPVVLVVEPRSGAVVQRYTEGPTPEDVRRVVAAIGGRD